MTTLILQLTPSENSGYFTFPVNFLGEDGTVQFIALNLGVRWNGSSFIQEETAVTQYASHTMFNTQTVDKYPAGEDAGKYVDEDGVIY